MLSERNHQLEVYVISSVVENSLPLSSIPKFIEFAKNLARDHKALSELKMNLISVNIINKLFN